MTSQPLDDQVSYPLAIIMEHVVLADRWATERWEAKGAVRDNSPPGTPEHVIVRGEKLTQTLFPGFTLRLHRDEAEGYYMNITSPRPKVFVMWRMDGNVARPELLTASYNEGARWMDSDEHVDSVPLPVELVSWVGEFAERHYVPEPKKPKRHASNKDKGHMGGF